MNELVSSKKFTNARSLLSIGLLSSGSTVITILVLGGTYSAVSDRHTFDLHRSG